MNDVYMEKVGHGRRLASRAFNVLLKWDFPNIERKDGI